MNRLILLFTLSLIYSPLTYSNSELFTISPYTVRADNGDIYLKFQTKKTAKVNIVAYRDNDENNTSLNEEKLAHRKKVMSFRLGKQNCDDTLGYKISFLSRRKSIQVIDRQLPKFECKIEDKFTFGFISDTQQGTKKHQKVTNIIEKRLKEIKVNFLLHTGDVVHKGADNKEWLTYFGVAQRYLKGLPIVAAVGNHAYQGKKENGIVPDLFKKYMRWKGSEKVGYQTALFPHFQLVIINSNFDKIGEHVEQQKKWLEDTLREAQREGRPVIVGMHHPPFASSMMTITKEMVTLRKQYVPLFEKYGVKLVLNGHTHMYERSFQNGVHYVIAGPAGGTRAMPLGTNPNRVFAKFLAMTFSTITVTKGRIALRSWDHHDKNIDNLEINY